MISVATVPLFAVPLPACADPVLPSRESGNYSMFCSEEWTKRGVLDRQMFGYCIRQQNEGYEKLTFETNQNKQLSWLQAVIDTAVDNWTKKGARQDAMVAYEVHRQIDAFRDMVYLNNQPKFQNRYFENCAEKWTKKSIDWTMVSYCYKHAIE